MRTRALATLLLAATAAAADLPERIQAAVNSAPAPVRGLFGIHVVDLATGKTVYARNDTQLFLPASNMKLFTTALALTHLGSTYTFETRLVREPSGDLVLVGSGDPSISGRVYPYDKNARDGDPLAAIENLADQAVAAGLRRVDGNIVGDDRRYLWSPFPASWTADDMQNGYGAPVSALSINDNIVAVGIRPGASPGALARISLSPRLEYFAIDNRITTVAGSGAVSVHLARVPGTRQLLLTGTIGARSAGLTETVPLDDPALYAAHALYNALLNRGVTIRGRPTARHRLDPGNPPMITGELLAVRHSPPLAELLRALAKTSQNLHAELMLREVAYIAQGDGTAELANRELLGMLEMIDVPPTEWRTEDGSGLARNDEVTPRAITSLLAFMAASPQGDLWQSFLPVGGEDGTLSNRLCCVSDGGGIAAKTGTLARAVALSGYAQSRGNGRLAFSILVNNFAAPSSQVRAWVDKIAKTLVE